MKGMTSAFQSNVDFLSLFCSCIMNFATSKKILGLIVLTTKNNSFGVQLMDVSLYNFINFYEALTTMTLNGP